MDTAANLGSDSLPHYQLLKEQTSIDPDTIYSTLISQRLTLRDAEMKAGPYTVLLSTATDPKASEMKRFKKGSPDKIVPTRSYITNEKAHTKPISKKMISRAYKHLGLKIELACDDATVVKGTIISLVRTLDAELMHSGQNDVNSDFDRPGLRSQTIADWLNWILKRKYNIDSKYTKDQVRQMLKKKTKSEDENKNKYAGRFTTPLIAF